MHIMVDCKSYESYRLLKTVLVGRDRFFERLSGLPITKFVKDLELSSTRSPLTRVAPTHCLYSNFHLDDLKTAV